MKLSLPNYGETLRLLEKEKEVGSCETPTCVSTKEDTPKCEGSLCPIAKKTIQKEKKNAVVVSKRNSTKKKTISSCGDGELIDDGSLEKPKIKVLNISYPIEIPAETKTNKRFSLFVEYSSDNKFFRKKINFGEKGVSELIDGDQEMNFLSPNFYRINLLNKCKTIKDAYINLIQQII